MYESHYGFSKAPFSINPDPAFLYLNSNYREAIALLQYGIQEHKGIVTLVGEVGTGKTMLLNQLLQSLDQGAASIMIPTVRFPYHDLVDYLLDKLNPSPGSLQNKTRFDVLYDLLISRDVEGKPVVVLVDEAQDLDNDTLESIRLLSNLETPSRKLLQIILVGQPELRHKLNLPELRQLKQRIAISFTLKPLSADETPSYIAHRLQGAGYLQGTALFTDDALELITHYSKGIPRVVNAICDNALLIGFAANRRWIDSAMIVEAAQDLMLDPMEVHLAAESGKGDSAAVGVVPPAGVNAQRGAGGLGRWVYVVAVLSVAIGASYAGLRFGPNHWRERLGELATSAEGGSAWLFSADPNGGESSYRAEPQASDNGDPVSSLPSADPSAEGKPVKPHADAPAPVPTVMLSVAANVSNEADEDVPGFEGKRVDFAPPAEPTALALGAELQPAPGGSAGAEAPASTSLEDEADVDVPGIEGKRVDFAPPAEPTALAPGAELQPAPGGSAGAEAPASTSLENGQRRQTDPRLPAQSGPTQTSQPVFRDLGPVGGDPIRQTSAVKLDATSDPHTNESVAVPPLGLAAIAKAVEMSPGDLIKKTRVVKTLQSGETITGIARQVYGGVSSYKLTAIKMANPEIHDLDRVDKGRDIIVPDLPGGLMILDHDHGHVSVLLSVSRSLALAEHLQAISVKMGFPATITPDKLSRSIEVYRLQSPDLQDQQSVLARMNEILALRATLAELED